MSKNGIAIIKYEPYSNLTNSQPFVSWYGEAGGKTISLPINGRCLIMCRHSGGSNYIIGIIRNREVNAIIENGSAFSFLINQNADTITITSSVQYWVVALI